MHAVSPDFNLSDTVSNNRFAPPAACPTDVVVPPAPAAAVAMAGKDCVAIGSDLRFGVQLQTLATDYKKIHKIHDQLFIGLAGLGTDAETL